MGVGAPDLYRSERKYVVSELAADRIRQFIAPYLSPDEHMDPRQPLGYQVLSLYLDTSNLALCRQTVEGVRSRYKLRIRFYDTLDEGLALLEIKSRVADAIHKQRAAITKAAAASLLCHGRLSSNDLLSPSDKAVRALAEFCERRERLNAEGTAFVMYWRVAYVSGREDNVRVTMDRQLTAADGRLATSPALPDERRLAAPDKVVLELKFSGHAPSWMRDLVRTFRLQRVSFPKYVYCVDALGLAPAHPRRFEMASHVRMA
jgi:hypothetical protein